MIEPFKTIFDFMPGWFDRRRKLRSHWISIKSEFEECGKRAHTIIGGRVQAPLYRLPTTAYDTAYPMLRDEGVLNEKETKALGRYSELVREINRGLDAAADAEARGPSQRLLREHERNVLKAHHLVENGGDGPGLQEQAEDIAREKINTKWWQY